MDTKYVVRNVKITGTGTPGKMRGVDISKTRVSFCDDKQIVDYSSDSL